MICWPIWGRNLFFFVKNARDRLFWMKYDRVWPQTSFCFESCESPWKSYSGETLSEKTTLLHTLTILLRVYAMRGFRGTGLGKFNSFWNLVRVPIFFPQSHANPVFIIQYLFQFVIFQSDNNFHIFLKTESVKIRFVIEGGFVKMSKN